jgi:4'-phosphopantetheinyl transferase
MMDEFAWTAFDRERTKTPSIERPSQNQVHLYCLDFAPYLEAVSRLSEWLSEEERQRAARLRFADGRDRFILSHAYTRFVLARYLGIHPRDVEFGTSETGKPWVVGESGGMEERFGFNLSHCKTYVVVAVAPTLLVGVDVEEHRPNMDALGIAKRYFAPKEFAVFETLAEEEIEPYFLKIWTCKEAFVKAIGLGLSYSLNRFQAIGLQDNRPELIGIEPDYGPSSAWSLRTCRPAQEVHIAIAVRLPNAAIVQCG